MTHEEIREAIKQVQAQAMSLHRRNLEIAANTLSTTRISAPLWIELLVWWWAVLLGALLGTAISWALLR